MTVEEAVKNLVVLVGSGGLVTLLVAWLGVKQAAIKGRPDTTSVVAAVGSGLLDRSQFEFVQHSLETTNSLLARIVTLLEETEKNRERDELMHDIIAKLRASGLQLGTVGP